MANNNLAKQIAHNKTNSPVRPSKFTSSVVSKLRDYNAPGLPFGQHFTGAITAVSVLGFMIITSAHGMSTLQTSSGEKVVYPIEADCPKIWSNFGDFDDMDRNCCRDKKHDGLDVVAARGTPIYPAADGEAIIAGYRNRSGNRVLVRHGPDKNGHYLFIGYLHMDKIHPDIMEKLKHNEKAKVKRGETILGYVGSTGKMPKSRTPHLHFNVWFSYTGLYTIKKGSAYYGSARLENPHDWWFSDPLTATIDQITIPTYVRGEEYPPLSLTYPLSCKLMPVSEAATTEPVSEPVTTERDSSYQHDR